MQVGNENEDKIRRLVNPTLLGLKFRIIPDWDTRFSCTPDDLELVRVKRGYEFKTRVTAPVPYCYEEVRFSEYIQCQQCLALCQPLCVQDWLLCYNEAGRSAVTMYQVLFDAKLWNETLLPRLTLFADKCDAITAALLKLYPGERYAQIKPMVRAMGFGPFRQEESEPLWQTVRESMRTHCLLVGTE